MFNVVFTDEGRALIAEIASDIDYSLLISDVKFSDHDYTGQEATVTEATFTGDFASGTNTISIVDSTTMRIESSFDNRYITEQKDLYTIGIFAKCVKVNGMIYTEIDSGLLAVCTVSTPRIIPPYADAPFSVFSYNINLAVGSADNVTVVETQAGVQYKELTTPLTINGTQETTVEGALGGLNDYSHAIADNLAANENVYGSKNLLPYPYFDTTKSANGLTFTDNGDGSVTVSGTASANTSFLFAVAIKLRDGDYLLSGCPSGGSISGFHLYLEYQKTDSTYVTAYDTGDGKKFNVSNLSSGGIQVNIYVESGTVISTPITFYPMLRDARIVDDTFVPYAQTNLQLTNGKAERSDLATLNLTGSTNSTGSTINAGTFFYLNGEFCKAITSIANGATFTLNTNFEIVTVGEELKKWTLIASATADGVKTYSQMISEISSQYPATEPYKYIIVKDNSETYRPMGRYSFVIIDGADTNYASIYVRMISLASNKFYEANGTFTPTDYSANVPTSGQTIQLYKIA